MGVLDKVAHNRVQEFGVGSLESAVQTLWRGRWILNSWSLVRSCIPFMHTGSTSTCTAPCLLLMSVLKSCCLTPYPIIFPFAILLLSSSEIESVLVSQVRRSSRHLPCP
jgi:hypothetical protein